MEPIVNPALIYLIGTVDSLKGLCVLVSIFTWVWIVVICYTRLIEGDEESCPNKYVIIVAVTFLLLTILIPSQETLIAMVVSSCVTSDNVMVSEQHIIDMITRITEAVAK